MNQTNLKPKTPFILKIINDWFDCRFENDDYPIYEPLDNGDNYADLEDFVVEDDTSDEEYKIARDRMRGCNRKLYDLAHQLHKEAVEGRLGAQEKCGTC